MSAALEPDPLVDREALGRSLADIVALGCRFPGTEGEQRARSWLLEAFARLGLEDVRAEPFPYLAYEPLEAACEHVGGGAVTPCAGLQCTCDAVVEADAVYVGRGTEAEIDASRRAGLDPRGMVAVLHGGLINAVVPGLVASGAAAIVNIGESQGGHVGHFTASFYPPPPRAPWAGRVLDIPGVTVEAEAGLRLVSALGRGERQLRVTHRARYREAETANVVGRLPGEDASLGEVVVGGHYDSQLESPGASDNASGLAALLEIARVLRERPRSRGVVFVAFAAEELAAWGAYAYVLQHLRDPPGMAAMVNLDALGAPLDATRTIVADRAVAALAAECARAVGWEVGVTLDAGAFPFADHIPFVDAGIPACWLWRYPPNHPYYHSAGDVLRHVDVGRLAQDTTAAAAVVERFARRDFAPGAAAPTERTADILAAAVG